MKNALFFFIVIAFVACQANSDNNSSDDSSDDRPTLPQEQNSVNIEDTSKSEQFSFQTFEHERGGWGYQILENQKLFINQPHIPAVSGVKTFINHNEATKTAEFVVYKLTNNIFPPSVSKDELDSLGITY